jgi:hypothetical protein
MKANIQNVSFQFLHNTSCSHALPSQFGHIHMQPCCQNMHVLQNSEKGRLTIVFGQRDKFK